MWREKFFRFTFAVIGLILTISSGIDFFMLPMGLNPEYIENYVALSFGLFCLSEAIDLNQQLQKTQNNGLSGFLAVRVILGINMLVAVLLLVRY